jgi:hypothetical protein
MVTRLGVDPGGVGGRVKSVKIRTTIALPRARIAAEDGQRHEMGRSQLIARY